MIKGSMNAERLPIIKINKLNNKYVEQIKYLEVIVDKRLDFIAQARFLRTKFTHLVMAIRRIVAEKWGLKTDILKSLHGAVALPIIKYGSILWFDAANKALIKRNLLFF